VNQIDARRIEGKLRAQRGERMIVVLVMKDVQYNVVPVTIDDDDPQDHNNRNLPPYRVRGDLEGVSKTSPPVIAGGVSNFPSLPTPVGGDSGGVSLSSLLTCLLDHLRSLLYPDTFLSATLLFAGDGIKRGVITP